MSAPLRRLIVIAFAASLTLGATAGCARKSGCPVNEAAHAAADKKGEFKKSKTKSELFPKDMRQRMKKG